MDNCCVHYIDEAYSTDRSSGSLASPLLSRLQPHRGGILKSQDYDDSYGGGDADDAGYRQLCMQHFLLLLLMIGEAGLLIVAFIANNSITIPYAIIIIIHVHNHYFRSYDVFI